MPLRSLQTRVRDLARRLGGTDTLGALHVVSWQDAPDLGLGEWAPLNTEAGQQFVLHLCDRLKPDVVVFDNLQALVTGDLREELPWNQTWPLVLTLTSRNIAQLWLDHTGHEGKAQYGSSKKAWGFDAVAIMSPLPREELTPGELAFTVSFDPPGKARNRTPENWQQFAPQTIRLRDNRWTSDPAARTMFTVKKLSPVAEQWRRALLDALAISTTPGRTTRTAWYAEAVRAGLADPIEPQDDSRDKDRKRAAFRKNLTLLKAAGLIGVDGETVTSLEKRT
jgi:hypothetical protein